MSQRVCDSPFCEVKFVPKVHNQRFHSQQCKRDFENISRRRIATSGTFTLEREAAFLREDDEDTYVDDLSLEEQLEHVRSINRVLARENAKLKAVKYEISHFVEKAVSSNLKNLSIEPVKKKIKLERKKNHSPEVAIATLSDWQLGKKTISYNVEECEKAIELYAEKLIRITELQRSDHPVNELHVWFLGDMVEGEAIFPSQAHHLDKSLYYQVAVDGPRIVVNFLRKMLTVFDKIHVFGIAGNHGIVGGRSRHEIHPETNADRMLYAISKSILENEPRIEWTIPNGELEGDFYAIDNIGEKRFFLFHGHQVPGARGVPYSGLENRIKGWATGAVDDDFDYAFCGHFHTPSRITINKKTLWINGTTESGNGYAVEKLGAIGRPCQYLFFTHPEHGITSEYCVYLDY